MERLELATAGYTGHHLEDDPYEDWSTEVRDELHSLSTEVKRELVAQLAASEHPERAIPWLVGLVADDPYDEASTATWSRRWPESRQARRGRGATTAATRHGWRSSAPAPPRWRS